MDGVMIEAIEHVSRHHLSGGELQVVADAEKGVEALIEAEKRVTSGFLQHGGWPHKRVNLFVFQSLQPLMERMSLNAPLSAAGARELDHAPMVHVYDEDDLEECSIFVNRALMVQHGVWEDVLALEGLLAHEHAHPMAENAASRAARALRMRLVTIDVASRKPGRAASRAPSSLGSGRIAEVGYSRLVRPGAAVRRLVAGSLANLAQDLCIKAPHEVFANEYAIRAGFGAGLERLSQLSLSHGRSGMVERVSLSDRLRAEVNERRLSEQEMSALLLAASAEAHLRVALEIAPFIRAGRLDEARAVEALAEAEVFSHVEPEIGVLVRALCDSYQLLKPDMDLVSARDWAGSAFLPIIEAFARRGAAFGAEFFYPRQIE
jgi:hypothetical protein